uniref:Uncharacterized protein n=1 Tax=Candidatus Kentrum sp. FW TaxID=2126338 RepID=A0A450TY60_9GAMM|nr:MAG: hypothetical protein BECKFW1821C_GA0114237_106110 [Candidatus Kentron sp. FW]
MPYQNIDASLSPADKKLIRDAFDTILKENAFPDQSDGSGAPAHLQGRTR